MSKGSRQRTRNSEQFNDNYNRIFGVKNGDDQRVPRIKEEECSDEQGRKISKKAIV